MGCYLAWVSKLLATGIPRLLPFIKKLHWWWKTCQTHLASIMRIYKYLLSKQWFYTVSVPCLQIKSANMHRWNMLLIEALSMLASPQIKMIKPPDKKPGISDRLFFLCWCSVEFQFVWQKLCYNIHGRAASKACWLMWFILRIPKILHVLAQDVPHDSTIMKHTFYMWLNVI